MNEWRRILLSVAAGWLAVVLILVSMSATAQGAGDNEVGPARVGPIISSTVSVTPPPPRERLEPEPAHATFVIYYSGHVVPLNLSSVLADLEMAGQVIAVDAESAPGLIFVMGEERAVLALRDLAGVTAVGRADAPLPDNPLFAATALDAAPPAVEAVDAPPDDELFPPPPVEPPPPPPTEPDYPPTPPTSEPENVPIQPLFCAQKGSLPPGRRSQPCLEQTNPARSPSSISANGAITGVVVADDGGAPLTGIGVCAHQSSPYVYQCATTDAGGVYSVSVPAGSYRVTFIPYDHHISEYYNDIPLDQYNNYTPVSVSDGAVTPNINAGLAAGMQIIGRVTDQTTGNPLPGIAVSVNDADWDYEAGDYSGADGVYTTTPGLPPGSYRVEFNDYSGAYAHEYYDDAYRPAQATWLTLTNASQTGIDAALSTAAVITGVVTGPGPLNNITVQAYYADENTSAAFDYTNVSGTYRLTGLAPIPHKVAFRDYAGNYLSEWHQDKADWDTADPVSLTGGVTTTVNAQLTPGGVISGLVTAAGSGLPLEGMVIYLYDASTEAYITNASTNITGTYRLGGLAAGTYKLNFHDDNGLYLTEYYDDKPDLASADPITVTAGMTTTANAQLTPGGVISGTVVAEGSGAPLEGIQVTLYEATTGDSVTSASTNISGTYRIGGLKAENYKLHFYDYNSVYLEEYYDDKATLDSADPVTVTAGVTTTINAQLTSGSIISGAVTDEDGGAPLNNVTVTAYDAATDSFVNNANTSISGTYRIGGLTAGSYKLRFYDNSGLYLNEYYNDKPNISSADPVTITAGTTTTVNAQLTPAGFISGAVTAEGSGAPLEGVSVTAYDAATHDWVNSASTNISGTYRINSLKAGSYKLKFSDGGGAYLEEYYNDKPDLNSADPVTVTAGTTTTVNAQLTSAGFLSGTVTAEESGAPLENVRVYAYDAANISRSDYTDASGVYRIGGLASGDYKLRFYDNNSLYLEEYYDNKPDRDSADPVAVTAGMTTTVNAQLSPAGVLSGTVTAEESGAPLESVRVYAYDAANNYRSDYTNSSGVYRIGGLASGDYKLRFYDNNGLYLEEYYDDKPDLDSADPVTVTAGMTATINAALTRGGRVTGRVTDTNTGDGIAGVWVEADRQDAGSPYGWATSDANGYYTTTALHSGVYRVSFSPPKPYYSEYYDNFRRGDDFTPVSVTVSLTTSGVNASLRTGYLISGAVTASGAPSSGVWVYAYYRGDSGYKASATTNSGGAYQLSPLDPGPYRVWFKPAAEHASLWYNDAAEYADAEVINLSGDATNIDAHLTVGGRITGTVAGDGGAPLANMWVYVYRAGESSSIASGRTDANGRYVASPGLSNGEYQVKFSAPAGYTTEWYDGQSSQASATIIAVTTGMTVTNINAQLSSFTSGVITGVITAGDTGLPLSMWVYAYNPEGDSVRSVYANNGQYVLSYLPPDTYRLRFSASSPYVQVYYNGHPDLASGDLVTVTAGITVANINQVIPLGGAITGTVTASGGAPGVYVYARRVVGGYATKYAYTGIDGGYRLEGLSAGGYKVRFSPTPPLVDEWYNDVPSESAADILTITLGAVTPNIDASLAEGGIITGLITAGDTGAPLPGAYARVYSAGGAFVLDSLYADMDGRYQTSGLPGGDYNVLFDKRSWAFYQNEWYDDAASQSAALTVTVAVSGAMPNINGALDKGGSVSGWTYNTFTKQPLNSVYVTAYQAADGAYVNYDYSNGWGFYQISGLPSDDYKIRFSKSGYETQWYSQTLDSALFLTVTVSAPGDTPNINAYLWYGNTVHLPVILK